ncbi:MAG: alcohol dehydrogenase catalytic domain-containing protein [Spirochaetaceae bacterium]|nr:alcohol dehydrogenase catalytic domain-containing protein [Spirochaetaceae bacterium]
MKAVMKVRRAPGIEVREVDVPAVGDGDILVKVAAAGICGSDVHYYQWTRGSEIVRVPVVLGHEFSGEVVEVGSGVTGVAVGDRICAPPGMACGACPECRTGRGDRCGAMLGPGIRSDGFFAEYGRLTAAAQVFKLPPQVSLAAAAMMEPLGVCLNAVDMSGLRVGQTAAVLGPGPIGLLTAALLRAGGAGLVVVAGTGADGMRLGLAERLGADEVTVVDGDAGAALAARAASLDGGGFDLVFEATGSPAAIQQSIDLVKRGGQVVLLGIYGAPAAIDPTPMVRARKNIISAYGYGVGDAATWQRALRLLAAGRLDVEPIITHRVPLAHAEDGFRLVLQKQAAKVLLIPDEGA